MENQQSINITISLPAGVFRLLQRSISATSPSPTLTTATELMLKAIAAAPREYLIAIQKNEHRVGLLLTADTRPAQVWEELHRTYGVEQGGQALSWTDQAADVLGVNQALGQHVELMDGVTLYVITQAELFEESVENTAVMLDTMLWTEASAATVAAAAKWKTFKDQLRESSKEDE